ncbi:MAG: hypothetical protein IJE97_12860 [Thermoguttaceae bacterium]|nr:hypothetical protein [Thermoguttaceae bacterium]MBQ6828581.1 hypothetical protein [Thermoguttaceae bacterium]MBQ7028911.1 hypothetical protein [Thermoguttaceae bacterium]MBQ7110012.1 hypothetical protein [Thermoguttaceae bacterium]
MENSLDVGVVLQIKRQTLATLAELAREPKPTYKIDGAVVSWTEYQESLRQTVDWCDKQLNALTPFELRSFAVVD